MTNVFPFYGTIHQCWDVFYSEYRRLNEALGRSPFEFESPKHSAIHEYVPKDGDEIIVYFWNADHKQTLLVVEAEIVPDEDRKINIFVHPQGNPFEEPVKSAIQTWRQIKKTLEKAQKQRVAPKGGHRRHRRYGSLKKLLEKIASRDENIAEYGVAPAWSLVAAGELSERTANEINAEMGGVIREKWDTVNVSGEELVNLVVKAYTYHSNLKAEWKRLKGEK